MSNFSRKRVVNLIFPGFAYAGEALKKLQLKYSRVGILTRSIMITYDHKKGALLEQLTAP